MLDPPPMLAAGAALAVRRLESLLSVAAGTTRPRSVTDANGRPAMIFFAVAAPMPGSASSSFCDAVLTSTVLAAACDVLFAAPLFDSFAAATPGRARISSSPAASRALPARSRRARIGSVLSVGRELLRDSGREASRSCRLGRASIALQHRAEVSEDEAQHHHARDVVDAGERGRIARSGRERAAAPPIEPEPQAREIDQRHRQRRDQAEAVVEPGAE